VEAPAQGRAIQAPANAGAEFSLTLVGQGKARIGSNFFGIVSKGAQATATKLRSF
jgi:hypothetical protein